MRSFHFDAIGIPQVKRLQYLIPLVSIWFQHYLTMVYLCLKLCFTRPIILKLLLRKYDFIDLILHSMLVYLMQLQAMTRIIKCPEASELHL